MTSAHAWKRRALLWLPIAVATSVLAHFTIAAITLVKAALSHSSSAEFTRSPAVLIATVLYCGFAIWFGLVLTTHPIQK